MSQLFAFNNAEMMEPLENSGRYDAQAQLWVAENESVANTETDGLTAHSPTGTLDLLIIPDADITFDWQ